ncbi:hypothetical protein WJX72_006877 [[Myrmecia] bisecta]|uniref:Secreted protein n=1 Tax=[Myrmecia] bisecta TaxID=41462 RepID=A0AAW1R753_9CHLO
MFFCPLRAAFLRCLFRHGICLQTAQFSSAASEVVTSLAEASRRATVVKVLDLSRSSDLLCVNLLCEKVATGAGPAR